MIYRTKKNQKGFSLLELLIVVAIILIIAAIAIPNLLKSKVAANQASAAANLRSLSSAEYVYHAAVSPAKYDTIANLATNGQLSAQQWINAATTGLSGYTFVPITAPTSDNYSFVALPVNYNSSGKDGYCLETGGVVHRIDGSAAAPTAPADEAACAALPALGQ